MRKGYKPKVKISSHNIVPPHEGSSIKKEEKEQTKSFGRIIDELLDNPKIMMIQAGKIIQETKEEMEKVMNKNKKLEEEIIEKDKKIAYLRGKIDGLEKQLVSKGSTNIIEEIINKMISKKITPNQARELLWFDKR